MSTLIYNLDGCRGRHIDVFDDKVILSVEAGIGSFLTGNLTDGEKTIYYSDCIGVQFKRTTLTIGYLQFETAGNIMNNRANNFFNENTFTWELRPSNEEMEEVFNYVKSRVDYYKNAKNNGYSGVSAADEIKKYKELLDLGVITQSEFDVQKNRLLGTSSQSESTSQSVSTNVQQYVCPKCGTYVFYGEPSCKSCGQPFAW